MMDFLNSTLLNNINIWHLTIVDFAFIGLFFKLRERFMNSIMGVWIFYFLGTFLHEMAHFLVALVLGAKPKFPFLFPKKDFDGSTILGRVETASVKWYNGFPIAIAPLSLFVVAFILQRYYFSYFDFSFLSTLFYFYLLIVLIDSAIPSSQDIRIAVSGLNLLGGSIWILTAFFIYKSRAIHFIF